MNAQKTEGCVCKLFFLYSNKKEEQAKDSAKTKYRGSSTY